MGPEVGLWEPLWALSIYYIHTRTLWACCDSIWALYCGKLVYTCGTPSFSTTAAIMEWEHGDTHQPPPDQSPHRHPGPRFGPEPSLKAISWAMKMTESFETYDIRRAGIDPLALLMLLCKRVYRRSWWYEVSDSRIPARAATTLLCLDIG